MKSILTVLILVVLALISSKSPAEGYGEREQPIPSVVNSPNASSGSGASNTSKFYGLGTGASPSSICEATALGISYRRNDCWYWIIGQYFMQQGNKEIAWRMWCKVSYIAEDQACNTEAPKAAKEERKEPETLRPAAVGGLSWDTEPYAVSSYPVY